MIRLRGLTRQFVRLLLLAGAVAVLSSCGARFEIDGDHEIFELGDLVEFSWSEPDGDLTSRYEIRVVEVATGDEVYADEFDVGEETTWTAGLFRHEGQYRNGEYRIWIENHASGNAGVATFHLTHWDWIENRRLDSVAAGTIDVLPYHTRDSYIWNEMTADDLHPRHGWVLVAKETNAPASPHFALYHRYSGTLRVFYFNRLTNETFTEAKIELSAVDVGPNLDPMIGMLAEGGVTLEERNSDLTLTAVGRLFPNQWNYVDFAIVGYLPSPGDAAEFNLDIDGVDTALVQLQGEIDGETDRPKSKSSEVGEFVQGVGTAGKAVADAFSTFSKSDKARKAARDVFASDKDGSNFGSFAYEALDSDLAKAVPYLNVAAPIVKGVFFESAPSTIQIKGQLSISGDITTSADVANFSIPVPGANPRPGAEASLYPHPIGIFAITSRPILELTRTAVPFDDPHTCINRPDDFPPPVTSIHDYELQSLQVEVNPTLGKNVQVDYAYITPEATYVDQFNFDHEGVVTFDGYFTDERFTQIELQHEVTTCTFALPNPYKEIAIRARIWESSGYAAHVVVVTPEQVNSDSSG